MKILGASFVLLRSASPALVAIDLRRFEACDEAASILRDIVLEELSWICPK
jgi:hypothetical protein